METGKATTGSHNIYRINTTVASRKDHRDQPRRAATLDAPQQSVHHQTRCCSQADVAHRRAICPKRHALTSRKSHDSIILRKNLLCPNHASTKERWILKMIFLSTSPLAMSVCHQAVIDKAIATATEQNTYRYKLLGSQGCGEHDATVDFGVAATSVTVATNFRKWP
ncbi:predicted protein [Arabidopsis lyrata subsp. lyrata]|uniref:Predicted protein n=1 Tax=Arabidopsis lyrata subsp. lyrata TaxID=81972 RepID=D7L5N6_ARALL|nr:predicted protein [Arabidopsis lyrata subsp. lyrata]